MATINITIQSLLHFSKYDLQIVDTAGTIGELKTAMETNFSYSADWFDLIFRNQTLDPAQTIGSYGIIEGSQLRIHNKIARLATKELRQKAKLDLATLDRIDSGETRTTYDITQLPTQYDNNGIIDNPNIGGLVEGRPWVSVVNPAPVTQDLILFFDSERTDCYPGTGTTIYNLVDNTPSTLFGDVTYSSGILRIHNEDTPQPGNRLAGIQCQTVTGFRTISLWYKQITSSAGYYSYIVDARTGMGGGWIYDTPNSDWFGGDWASGSMFINGGATQSPTYTQQLNVWRNVTFVTNDTAFTDNITLFSRFTREEGLDVEFGACMIYSRAITEAENKHNYDEFKTRYGL